MRLPHSEGWSDGLPTRASYEHAAPHMVSVSSAFPKWRVKKRVLASPTTFLIWQVKKRVLASPALVNAQPAGRWSALHRMADLPSHDVRARARLPNMAGGRHCTRRRRWATRRWSASCCRTGRSGPHFVDRLPNMAGELAAVARGGAVGQESRGRDPVRRGGERHRELTTRILSV
jgi:hypothetical protein